MMRVFSMIATFLIVAGAVFWAASGALSKASERTVTYQYIADALDALTLRPSHVAWEPPITDLVRSFTPADETLIGQSMTDAWHALALAQNTGEPSILQDVFSGIALERAVRAVSDARHGGQMVVLSQTARPAFFHLDGSVFQAEVEMQSVRYLIVGEELVYHELVTDIATTTLMNESNGWRIYAHERTGVETVEATAPRRPVPVLNGFNYYPSETPWRAFWPNFDAQIIARDFNKIADLGGTAVRVFLTAKNFTAKDSQEESLDDLETLLELAEQAGLRVVPTLFDLKPSYEPAGWGQDYVYLQAVLPVLSASPAVALVDLKNEPDLDFEAYGRPEILAWLKTMVQVTRQTAPDLPLTIGWSKSDAALELEPLLDVVTYHDYADISSATTRLDGIKKATQKPVMVTEIGVTSFELALGQPSSVDNQAKDLAARILALSDADGVIVWALHDFPEVDPSAVGGSPWVQRLQSAYGVIAADGKEKPAAAVVRQEFQRRMTPQ